MTIPWAVHWLLLTLFASTSGNFLDSLSIRWQSRGFLRNRSETQPRGNGFFSSRFLTPRQVSQSSRTNSWNTNSQQLRRPFRRRGTTSIQQPNEPFGFPRVPINDQTKTSFGRPGYLDPANFRLPTLTVKNLEETLNEIERHTRAKGSNPADYTSSRLLITLLREQCARMLPSADASLEMFCTRFRSRFRSFFF